MFACGLAGALLAGAAPGQTGAAVKPASEKKLAFEVASIRTSKPDRTRFKVEWWVPGRFRAVGVPLESIVEMAYFGPLGTSGRGERLILGFPDWVNDMAVDIQATVAPEDVENYKIQGSDMPMLQRMLQTMLEERFGIVVHRVTVDEPVYALEVGRHGAKVKEDSADHSAPEGGYGMGAGGWMVPYKTKADPRVRFVRITMPEFARQLSMTADRPVVDRTGLKGMYEFEVMVREEVGPSDPLQSVAYDVEGAGLRLLPATAMRERVVVEKIEKASEN